MAAKLSKRDIARLGIKLPMSENLTTHPNNTAPKISKKGITKRKSGPAARLALAEHVAQQALASSIQAVRVNPDQQTEYPEWVEVELAGIHAVPKERQRFGKGFVFTSKRTREYERILKEKGVEVMGTRPLLKGPLETEVVISFKIPESWPELAKQEALEGRRLPTRKADWDNLAKAGTDSLNEVVYHDDSQIVSAKVSKVYATEPGILIRFREIQGVKGGWKRGE